MQIKTYADLTSPDERNTLVGFIEARTQDGFDIEIAARVTQEIVSHIDLHPDVPEILRDSFDRVRKVFTYGLFEYELFSVAGDQAILLLEQALRKRFVTLYDEVITLISNKDGTEGQIEARDFESVVAALNRGGSHAKGNWTVKLRSGGRLSLLDGEGKEGPFLGGLSQLLVWARQEDLLSGRRARRLDPIFVNERNRVAHAAHHLAMPTSAARTIYDMGETINRLWGHRTKGGSLYPAPIERTTVVVAWAEGGDRTAVMWPESIAGFNPPGEWTFVILQAVRDDESLTGFDARYERTTY